MHSFESQKKKTKIYYLSKLFLCVHPNIQLKQTNICVYVEKYINISKTM